MRRTLPDGTVMMRRCSSNCNDDMYGNVATRDNGAVRNVRRRRYDELVSTPELSLEARRAALEADGRAVMPGYWEPNTTIWVQKGAHRVYYVNDNRGEYWVAAFDRLIFSAYCRKAKTVWYSVGKFGAEEAERMARRHLDNAAPSLEERRAAVEAAGDARKPGYWELDSSKWVPTGAIKIGYKHKSKVGYWVAYFDRLVGRRAKSIWYSVKQHGLVDAEKMARRHVDHDNRPASCSAPPLEEPSVASSEGAEQQRDRSLSPPRDESESAAGPADVKVRLSLGVDKDVLQAHHGEESDDGQKFAIDEQEPDDDGCGDEMEFVLEWVKCSACQEEFAGVAALRRHVAQVHGAASQEI